MSPNEEHSEHAEHGDDPNALINWRISQLEAAVQEFRAESRKLYWTLVTFMLLNVVLRFLV